MKALSDNPFLETIEQAFLVTGHTFMLVDMVHALIERIAENYRPIFFTTDWREIFRRTGHQVVHLTFEEPSSLIIRKQRLGQLKMKFSYNPNDGYITYQPRKWQNRRWNNFEGLEIFELLKLYDSQIPITLKKRQDLLKLIDEGKILERYRAEILAIPFDNSKPDLNPPEVDECLLQT